MLKILRSSHNDLRIATGLLRKYTKCAYSTGAVKSLKDGPGLKEFITSSNIHDIETLGAGDDDPVPYLSSTDTDGGGRKVYFETYGCQMNVNDTEVAWSILENVGYIKTSDPNSADVILAVTCAVRDNAEQKVWSRLDYFRSLKRKRSGELALKVGVLGCMAERLKTKLLETDKMVDLVAGPDSYRDLPRLLSITQSGQSAVNVLLSLDETYADIMPVRINSETPSAFVSIMRGCDNMCSFCIVPFTRGRERSRDINTIVREVKALSEQGVKEVTLLGQNVNSYRDLSPSSLPHAYSDSTLLSRGFSTIYKDKEGGRRFAELLHQVSLVDPEMRVRFTSPHPKDFPDELLYLIREQPNICKHIHMPAQSGSTAVLERMRRGYSREKYLDLVQNIRAIIPDVTLSSDFMTGFCGETEEDHRDTLTLMEAVQYDMAYMFAYSMRKKTHAYHRMTDDVPEEVKKARLQELITTFHSIAAVRNQRFIGSEQLVLVEKTSKRSSTDFAGRIDGNIKVVFPIKDVPCHMASHDSHTRQVKIKPGDYVHVKINSATSLSLRGIPIACTNLQFYNQT
ncbi:mitochondrial tRNA methylthiotransferase CDK5RAP1-like [Halichondria panicea]|uniref:mitochondrial tRNA methylthiotransferase CDK5RAP1-like n=1 Tax=Halichondria panicea TaxID=6063 RepID=UPI00312BC939